jgi:hypothetical protein
MDFDRLSQETRLSIIDAGRLIARLRGQSRPAAATAWRWCSRGLRGVRLEHYRIGGRIVTTEQAVRRFLARVQADEPASAVVVTAAPQAAQPDELRRQTIDAAKDRLSRFAPPKTHRARKTAK